MSSKTTTEPSLEEGRCGRSVMADSFEAGGSGTEPSPLSESGKGAKASQQSGIPEPDQQAATAGAMMDRVKEEAAED